MPELSPSKREADPANGERSPLGFSQSIGAAKNLTVERTDLPYSLNRDPAVNLSQAQKDVNERLGTARL